jgi:hypothetical protein
MDYQHLGTRGQRFFLLLVRLLRETRCGWFRGAAAFAAGGVV